MTEWLRMDVWSNPEMKIMLALIVGLLFFVTIIVSLLSLSSKMVTLRKLTKDIKYWWTMAFVYLAATMISKEISFIILTIWCFVALRELYSILSFQSDERRAIIWLILAVPLQFFFAYKAWFISFLVFIPVGMFLFLPLRMVLAGKISKVVESSAKLNWVLMYAVFGISHMAYLLSLPETIHLKSGGRGLLLYLVFLTEWNNLFQFIFRVLLPKHYILQSEHRKLTWEGFLGGVIATILVAIPLRFITHLTINEAMWMGFVIGISGFFGKLVMRAVRLDLHGGEADYVLKRNGMLSRIECLAYSAPCFFYALHFTTI